MAGFDFLERAVQPGDYLVTKTGGFIGWCIRVITRSPVNHAAIYVGHDQIVEAQPKGATLSPVSRYPQAIWSTIELTDAERWRVTYYALDVVGTPYNFLDIVAQAIVRIFHWHAPKWALKRLSRADRLQCAQLVDLAYEEAGVVLFPDDRPEGLVAPSDLYDLIKKD